jgi:mannan endo-1,4-beta-mannosidase
MQNGIDLAASKSLHVIIQSGRKGRVHLMNRLLARFLFCAMACIAFGSAQTSIAQQASSAPAATSSDQFASRVGRKLYHRGKPFRVAGSNNYYLMYSSHFMVDDVLTTAAAQNFNTMRTWGFIDVGNQDGSNSVDGPHNGVYFHYWDGSAPAFNDGDTGLKHLDYVIYKASQLNIKLVIPFVNNYDQFGGMDQYVRWNGGQYHDQFYSDPKIRQWYKDWISHLLNHTNAYTGIQYKDDPTILSWELANEERCVGFGVYPQSSSCNTDTITNWAADVSAFVKSIDRKHLLSPGDEGFYCTDPTSSDFTINCSQGVDSIALAKLPDMDIISYHLYPDSWGKTPEWGTQWIRRHIEDSRRRGDRAVAGEWGLLSKNTRNPVYHDWEDEVLKDNGGGVLYWILSGLQDNGTLYPDYDGYTVYCPTPVCSAFTNFARTIQGLPFNHAPVADNDTVSTPNDTPVAVGISSNDITYGGVPLDLNSIDLDPSTAGKQISYTDAFGVYSLQPGGIVQFQPASACVSGNVSTPYTIQDDRGRISNPANIVVNVGGIAGELFNFEDGTDTWAAASYSQGAGTVAQSTQGATSCGHSLQINTAAGGFFGPAYNTNPLPLNSAALNQLLFDISTTSTGTSQSVAVQFGKDYHYCSTPFSYINANTSTTVTVDLQSLATAANCGGSAPLDKSIIQGFFVYFSGGGTYYLDNVRTH